MSQFPRLHCGKQLHCILPHKIDITQDKKKGQEKKIWDKVDSGLFILPQAETG